jgi:hypothetical protein
MASPVNIHSLEKLTVAQLLKTFPSFYGTRRSITVFTKARTLVPILSYKYCIYLFLYFILYARGLLNAHVHNVE